MKQVLLDMHHLYRQSFDNFVIGDNSEAVCSLMQLLNFHSESTRFIYLFGPESSGKTHLLRAATRRAVNAQYFDATLDPALEGASIGGHLLVVDNVDFLDSDGEGRLFNLFNSALRFENTRWLLSGRESPLFLKLRTDLRTRIATALIYRISVLSEQQKSSFLHVLAQERGICLTDSVVRLILNRIKRDVASLTYCIQAIDQASLELKKPVTLHLVRQVLSFLPSQG